MATTYGDSYDSRTAAICGIEVDSEDNAAKLGADMLRLNCQAVDARYGEGESKSFRDDLTYRFAHPYGPVTAVQAYKSLTCWLYQCSEGDVPETELYKSMERVSDALAHHIVSESSAYEAAKWG